MLNHATVALLQCPACRGGLEAACVEDRGRLIDGRLTCSACGAEYPVEAGVARLVARGREHDPVWQTWRDHLQGFVGRRAARSTFLRRWRQARWLRKMRAFAGFVGVPEGRMLDVGCGPGRLRSMLDTQRVDYHGVDPLPVAEANEFPFVCAVAEVLPFRDQTFANLVVRSALDHFYDLDAFFAEAARVLANDGHLFLEQAVHDDRGLDGLLRRLVHGAKDLLDDLRTRSQRRSAPKHMREFSADTLLRAAGEHFVMSRADTYRANCYTPTQVFLCLRRGHRTRDARSGGEAAIQCGARARPQASAG